jgi:thiamine-monophosphate kinase
MPDEPDVIRAMIESAGRLPSRYMKIGDDVAVVPVSRKKLVLKVDMLVERTDVPKGMTYRQAARKAVAMCISDFAAKGVRPDSFMISLGLRRETTDAEVEELAKGFKDAEKKWRILLVGGDTNEAGELVIDCVMVGFASSVVGRSGARPGDVLVVTGPFGFPPAGLSILSGRTKAEGSFRRKALESVLSPNPSLETGMALAPYLTSSMDSSDGLARSLHTLASMSGVGFEVDPLPMGQGVEGFAKTNGLDANHLVLAGGEEFVIVGTVNPRKLGNARRAVKRAGGELFVIGKATGEPKRIFLRSGRAAKQIPDEGWTHLG